MKQAKHHRGTHGHYACGNCAKTIRVRNDSKKVACITHLQMMPANHTDICEDYQAVVAEEESCRQMLA